MTERGAQSQPEHPIARWRGSEGMGYALYQFMVGLGFEPFLDFSQEKLIRRVSICTDFVENCLDTHTKRKQQVKPDFLLLAPDREGSSLYMRYRDSVRGQGSEGPSTLEFAFRDGYEIHPVLHVRFFEFTHRQTPTMVITALQRYTDDRLTTVEKPYQYSRFDQQQGNVQMKVPSLKEVDPRRYREYQNETDQIRAFEKKSGISFEQSVFASVLGYAGAVGNTEVLLTTYENQFWVKHHTKRGDGITVSDVYTPVSISFGLVSAPHYPGFWHMPGETLAIATHAKARHSSFLFGLAQAAYEQFLTGPTGQRNQTPHHRLSIISQK